jgi:hypothetical protein
MVSISKFTRKFANEQKYVVNFSYADDFDFPYVSFRINLGTPSKRPFILKALVKVCLGFGRADDLRNHAPARHRWPLPVGRPTSKLIAIKECSPAGRSGGWSRHDEHGVDRQTLGLLARESWSDGFVRRWRRMRNIGAL